jgi:hypothetical protein
LIQATFKSLIRSVGCLFRCHRAASHLLLSATGDRTRPTWVDAIADTALDTAEAEIPQGGAEGMLVTGRTVRQQQERASAGGRTSVLKVDGKTHFCVRKSRKNLGQALCCGSPGGAS